MIRWLIFTALSITPAFAQSEAPKGDLGEDRRYQFNQVEGGYLRLDTRTGQVSLCNRRPSGWACGMVADERAALDQEIDRLTSDNGRLKDENGRLKQALRDRGTSPPAADNTPRRGERGEALPRDEEIDRVMSAIERVWRRLVEMIVNLQKDMRKS